MALSEVQGWFAQLGEAAGKSHCQSLGCRKPLAETCSCAQPRALPQLVPYIGVQTVSQRWHLHGRTDRTSGSQLINKGLHPMNSILRIKLRDHQDQPLLQWLVSQEDSAHSAFGPDPRIPGSSSRTQLLNSVTICH